MKIRSFFIIVAILITLYSQSVSAQIERQQAINWCWAACIQSVVYQANRGYLSQAKIAETLSGWPYDRPAYITEVVNLCKYFGLRAWQAGRPGSPQELYSSLASGWKLIAFVRPTNGNIGHFILLQGFDYQTGLIIVSDPATGKTYPMTLNDLYYGWRWVDSVVVGT